MPRVILTWAEGRGRLACLILVLPLLAGCQGSISEWGPVERVTEFFKPSPKPLPLSLIPAPQSLVRTDGALQLADGTPVLCAVGDAACLWTADYLARLASKSRGLVLKPRSGDTTEAPAGTIVFRRVAGGTAPEGYRLTVTARGAVISASTDAGLFYGAVTFWQLLTQDSSPQVPAVEIVDSPRFAWRGLMLDSARHYQMPAFIKSFIDAMALHKLNVLHWHLTDDQAWRLEIKKYPRLTEVGAWRVPAGEAAAHDIDPATGKPRLYGGFYTQDEVRDIVAYAQRRNVTIVPEIEMPGHALAAIVAYPKLGSIARPPASVSSDWGVFPYLYNVDESTFAFLDDVLTEVTALFPGKYIDIGGDEAVKDEWIASPEVRARMRALGIDNVEALQAYFTARIDGFLARRGRRLIGWDEILQPGVPQDVTITSWRGIEGAIAAAKSGHDAVLSPAPTLYFDNRQADGAGEPPARGRTVTLKDVYGFDPAPPSLTPAEQSHVIGVQANIWTEHIREQDMVSYAAFPRAAALAELAWSPAATHDWLNFLDRLPAQFARYRALGIVHSESVFEVRAERGLAGDDARIALSDQAEFGDIRYTLDGTAPTATSPLYRKSLEIPLPAQMATTAFLGKAPLAAPVRFELGALSLLRRNSFQLKLCSQNLPLSLEDDAPLAGPRAKFLVDVMDPCWIYPKADLDRVSGIDATVGHVPFNFEIGADIKKVVVLPPATPAGELEIRLDDCNGERIAVLPLAPAAANEGLTTLHATMAPRPGVHDLCFQFTRHGVDPVWAIDWIQLLPGG